MTKLCCGGISEAKRWFVRCGRFNLHTPNRRGRSHSRTVQNERVKPNPPFEKQTMLTPPQGGVAILQNGNRHEVQSTPLTSPAHKKTTTATTPPQQRHKSDDEGRPCAALPFRNKNQQASKRKKHNIEQNKWDTTNTRNATPGNSYKCIFKPPKQK